MLHNWLQEKLLDMYSNLDFEDSAEKQLSFLVPLGLPDLETQKLYLNMKGYEIEKEDQKNFKYYGPFVNNKSRFSEKELDIKLINF